MMSFLLRIIGIWMLGMSVVLLVMDGTKSLAASNIVTTSIGNIWILAHAESLSWLQQVSTQGSLRIVWEVIGISMLEWPGWIIFGLPGVFLIFAGRDKSRNEKRR